MITISLEPSVPIQSYSTLLTIVLMLYSTQGYSSLQWKDVKPRCMRRNPKEPGCKIPRVLSQWSHTGCMESQLWCDNTCAVLCTWDAHLSLGVQGFYWGRGSHVDTHALMAGHSYWRSRRKALVKPQIPSFEQTRSTVQCSSRFKKKKKKTLKSTKHSYQNLRGAQFPVVNQGPFTTTDPFWECAGFEQLRSAELTLFWAVWSPSSVFPLSKWRSRGVTNKKGT